MVRLNRTFPNQKRVFDVNWTVLRAAPDQLAFYYYTVLDDEVWRRCAKAARKGEALVLKVPSKKGKDTQVLLRAQDANQVDHGRIIFADEGVNLRITVRRARPPKADGQRAPYRCVQVEIKGALLSQRITGRTLVENIRVAVERLFFPDRGKNRRERRKVLAPVTYPGDFHVMLDLAIGGKSASRWLENVLFAESNNDEAMEHWPARSSKDGTVRGAMETGRTLIISGKVCRFSGYERDKILRKKDAEAWERFQKLLRKLEWNGRDRLLRLEWQLRSDWLGTQEFVGENGKTLRGRDMTLDDLLVRLPLVMAKILERYRHTEPGAIGRRDKRPTSQFWQTVTTQAMTVLSARSKGATPVERMRAERIVAKTTTVWNRAADVVCRLVETGGPDGTAMELDEVVGLLRAMADDRRQQADYPAQRRKWLAQVHRTDFEVPRGEAPPAPVAPPTAALHEGQIIPPAPTC